jgi:protein TonB
MKIARYGIGSFFAIGVTLSLLVLMQTLVHQDEVNVDDGKQTKIDDVLMPDTEIETHFSERKPDKPDEQEEPPPDVEQPDMEDLTMEDSLNVAAPKVGRVEITMSGFGSGQSDGEYLPIVKIQAQYPRRATTRGIEGQCTVEYTVTKVGTTRNPVAVDCQPKGVFERASVKAAAKFKYKPRVVDGEAIDVIGVQNRFIYKLDK